MNVTTEVLDVLGNAVINENALVLTGSLDRKLYEKVNKVLDAAGGKWNRKVKAHLFDGDASEIIEQVILTGQITSKKSELGYFPTPKPVVNRLLKLAEVTSEMTVLEPSAGQGAIADELYKITAAIACVEIDPVNVEVLKSKGYVVSQSNFLEYPSEPVCDRVVMNPPFAKQVDIYHVMHAFTFLKPGGRLVAVMSAGVEFRSNKLTSDFRQFVADHNGTIERLPDGSFTESGTGVRTVIVTLEA